MTGTLTPEELRRYSRHLVLPQFGLDAQEKLKKAKILVVGAGGLGCPILLYLTAAGVGTIGIVDDDVVDESNLQRQILYDMLDVGTRKAVAAREKLQRMNPSVRFEVFTERLTSKNAESILAPYDIVADGTDNFPTRYLTNDACVFLGKPLVYGSIFQFEGQVSVFNLLQSDGTYGPNYRDLFPSPPPPDMVPSCAEGGVLGVLPGIIGSFQASEAIKIATGIGEPLSGRLHIMDALGFESRTLRFERDPENPINGKDPTIQSLLDYEDFCGMKKLNLQGDVTVHQLKEMFDAKDDFQLIDCREQFEREIATIGGECIPMAQLAASVEKIDRHRPVVIYCRSGARSARAVEWLKKNAALDNVHNLKGGILEYARQIDSSLRMY